MQVFRLTVRHKFNLAKLRIFTEFYLFLYDYYQMYE